MGEPNVSIIMAVYNTAEFLPETLESILAQTFGEFEVVCVNDGSTDGSAEILREYAAKDPRVVVIDQENLGGTRAREVGLGLARSEYVWFVDSDDVIPASSLAALHTSLVEAGADIAIGNYAKIDADGAVFSENVYPRQSAKGEVSFAQILRLNAPQLWNKVFRRGLFTGVDFSPVRIGQDLALSLQAAMASRKSIMVDHDVYHYRVYRGSISQTFRTDTLLDITRSLGILIARAKNTGLYESLEGDWNELLLRHCLHQLRKLVYLGVGDARHLQRGIRDFLAENLGPANSAEADILAEDVQRYLSSRIFLTPKYWRHFLGSRRKRA